MGQMSNYLEPKVLDHLLGKTTFTAAATLYLALYTVTPTAAGGGTEATGGGYVRLSITNNTTNFSNATGSSPSTKTNGVAFTMATATGDWSSASNMVAWAIWDDVAAGNMYYFGALTENKPVLNGDTASFASSQLSITQT